MRPFPPGYPDRWIGNAPCRWGSAGTETPRCAGSALSGETRKPSRGPRLGGTDGGWKFASGAI